MDERLRGMTWLRSFSLVVELEVRISIREKLRFVLSDEDRRKAEQVEVELWGHMGIHTDDA